jgi:hypothetical protein
MVSEQTKEEDEQLREELRHVDLEKLKNVLKPILAPSKKQSTHRPGNRKARRSAKAISGS